MRSRWSEAQSGCSAGRGGRRRPHGGRHAKPSLGAGRVRSAPARRAGRRRGDDPRGARSPAVRRRRRRPAVLVEQSGGQVRFRYASPDATPISAPPPCSQTEPAGSAACPVRDCFPCDGAVFARVLLRATSDGGARALGQSRRDALTEIMGARRTAPPPARSRVKNDPRWRRAARGVKQPSRGAARRKLDPRRSERPPFRERARNSATSAAGNTSNAE